MLAGVRSRVIAASDVPEQISVFNGNMSSAQGDYPSIEGVLEAEGQSYDMLFIDPDHCIDCGLCEQECPVNAIYPDQDVPSASVKFVQLNADFFRQR